MTMDEAAPKLYKTRSSLCRIETGETMADVHLVKSMMDLYDQYDPTLVDLAVDAKGRGWWRAYGVQDRGYVDLETEASQVLNQQLLFIPGMLQTEEYMRAVFVNDTLLRTRTEFENQVKVRRYRQRRLTDEEYPLELRAIIDESALRRPVGGAEVMREQLDHLVMLAELDTVTLQVFPWGPKPHAGMAGAFTILRYPEDDDPDLLYLEHPAGSMKYEDQPGVEEVRKARLVFEQLSAEALTPADSVVFIEGILGER